MSCFTPEELKALPLDTVMLEIGCGQRPVWEHSETLDINDRSKATHIHDLTVFPYPFADNTFDYVVAEHVLEHLPDVISVLDELHRIIKPTGQLRIEVPHYTCRHFFTDPTHKTSFAVRTLDYVIFTPDNSSVYQFHYSNRDWKKISTRLGGPTKTWLDRWLTRYFNDHQDGYEGKVAPLFPREYLNFVIQPIK